MLGGCIFVYTAISSTPDLIIRARAIPRPYAATRMYLLSTYLTFLTKGSVSLRSLQYKFNRGPIGGIDIFHEF